MLWLLDAVSIGFTVFQVGAAAQFGRAILRNSAQFSDAASASSTFQVFMIPMLESTSVFQRQRTLKTLSGMAAKLYTSSSGPSRVLPTTEPSPATRSR